MVRALFMVPLLVAVAAIASEPPGFEAQPDLFADDAACRAHLGRLVAAARAQSADAAEGPYQFEGEDHRAHIVRREGIGHRISEYRCESERLSGRNWRRSMEGEAGEFTVESAVRDADWLKKSGPEKQ